MWNIYSGTILILSILSLVLYLLFKNPYTIMLYKGTYCYDYKYETDYISSSGYLIHSKNDKFSGAWGRNKEEAKNYIEEKLIKNSPLAPSVIIIKRHSSIDDTYYIPIMISLVLVFGSIVYIITP